MRDIVIAIAMGLGALAFCIWVGIVIVSLQPPHDAQLRNPYWPYSVEASVNDR